MGAYFSAHLSQYNFVVPNIIAERLYFELWPISVKPLVDNRLSEVHWHQSPSIWYTVSGEYEHKINGVWHKQLPGSVSIILPYSAHQIDSRKSNLSELNVISVSLDKTLYATENIPFLTHSHTQSSFDYLPISSHFRFSGDDKKAADKIFLDALYEFRKQHDMDQSKISAYISSFFEICANRTKEAFSKKEVLNARQKFECVEAATSYINQNFSASIALEDISREAMMSQRSFTSAFTEIVGKTCHKYVTSIRINNALTLLRRPGKSLDEISAECGFYDRAHFIRSFKNVFGIAPSTWREDFLKWKEHSEHYALMSELRETAWLRPETVLQLKEKSPTQTI